MSSSILGWACALTVALAGSGVSAQSTPLGTLYGYGSGISGLPLFYSDGVAILGWGRPNIATVATNLTFTHVDDTLVATPNNTNVASNWTTPLLAIETRPGAKSDVTFVEEGHDSSNNDSLVSDGFEFYGRQLLWLGADEDSGAGRSFWASPLDGEDSLYKLFWNADNNAEEGTVPVTLKRQAPPKLTN